MRPHEVLLVGWAAPSSVAPRTPRPAGWRPSPTPPAPASTSRGWRT